MNMRTESSQNITFSMPRTLSDYYHAILKTADLPHFISAPEAKVKLDEIEIASDVSA